MNIKFIVVGNLKEKYWKDACDEYLKRLTKYASIELIEIKEESINVENQSNILISKTQEGKRILDKITSKDYVILLDINSNQLDSISLSNKLKEISDNNSRIAFVIGGSYGVSEDIYKRANYKLSFSKLTFPHQMARVMLLEQVYRCFKILNNERYHK